MPNPSSEDQMEVKRCTISSADLLDSRAALRDPKHRRSTVDGIETKKDSAALRNDVERRLSALSF